MQQTPRVRQRYGKHRGCKAWPQIAVSNGALPRAPGASTAQIAVIVGAVQMTELSRPPWQIASRPTGSLGHQHLWAGADVNPSCINLRRQHAGSAAPLPRSPMRADEYRPWHGRLILCGWTRDSPPWRLRAEAASSAFESRIACREVHYALSAKGSLHGHRALHTSRVPQRAMPSRFHGRGMSRSHRHSSHRRAPRIPEQGLVPFQ